MTETIKQAEIRVKIRTTGEFGNRRRVFLYIPEEFNFNDQASKDMYFSVWSHTHNLPEDHPFHDSIEEMQKSIRLHEMTVTSRDQKTFVLIIGETSGSTSFVTDILIDIFGSALSFDQ